MAENNNHINKNLIMDNNSKIQHNKNANADANADANPDANPDTSSNTNGNRTIKIKIKNTLYQGMYLTLSADSNQSNYSRYIALAKIKNIKNHCSFQNEHINSEKAEKEIDDKFILLNDNYNFDGFYQVCDTIGKSDNSSDSNPNKIGDLKKKNPNQCNFVSYQIILIKGIDFKELVNNFITKSNSNNCNEKYHYLIPIFKKIISHNKYLKNLKNDCFGNLNQDEMKLLFNLFNEDVYRYNNLGDNYEDFPSHKNIFCNISDLKYVSNDCSNNNAKYKFDSTKKTMTFNLITKYDSSSMLNTLEKNYINCNKFKSFIITHNIPFTSLKYDLIENLLQSNNEKISLLYPNGTIIFDNYGSTNFSELPHSPTYESWSYNSNMAAKHKWNTLNSFILSKQIRKHFHFRFHLEQYNDNQYSNITEYFHKENIKIIKFKISTYMENDFYDDMIHGKILINKKYLQILKNDNEYYNFLQSPLKVFKIDNILTSFNENSKTPQSQININTNQDTNQILDSNVESNSEDTLSCLSKLAIQPLPYQKKNITWMKQHERDILNKKFKFKFLDKPDFYYFDFKNEKCIVKTYYQNTSNPNSDGKLCLLYRNKMISSYKDYLYFNGGILSDQVGLGKTLSCIAHIINQIAFDNNETINSDSSDSNEEESNNIEYDANTLIILPPRLIDQWIFEIKKYVKPDILKNIKIKKIISINNIGKMSGMDLKQYHIYFISVNLLGNKKYFKMLDIKRHQFVNLKLGINNVYDDNHEIKMNLLFDKRFYPSKEDINKISNVETRKRLNENYVQPFNIFTLKWNRIFIDEFHESLIGNIEIPRLCSVESSGLSSHNYDVKFDYYKNCNCITRSIPLAKRIISENLINIKANFKWLISATPFESNLINLYYTLKFFNTNRFMNTNECKIDPFNNSIFSMKEKQIDKFMKHFIIRTTKKDIIGQVDVPLFTETVTYLKQTEIERRIYLYHQNNSITNSTSINSNSNSNSNSNTNNNTNNNTNPSQDINYTNMREHNILKLFKFCTHIMVAEEENLYEDCHNQTILSLSEITKVMVKRYKFKCNKLKKENIMAARLHDKHSKNIEKINYIYEGLKVKTSSYLNESSENYISSSDKLKITQFISLHKHKNLLECLLMLVNEEQSLYFGIDDTYINYEHILNNFFITWAESYYVFTNTEFLYLAFLVSKKVKDKILKEKESYETKYNNFNMEIKRLENQIKMFDHGDIIKKTIQDPCVICLGDYNDKEENLQVAVTVCRHFMCNQCIVGIFQNRNSAACPMCRHTLTKKDYYLADVESIQRGKLEDIKEDKKEEEDKPVKKTQHDITIEKYGTKLTYLIEYIQTVLENPNHRVIIFSQYKKMLEMVGYILDEFKIKKIYLKGNIYVVSKAIQKFKTDESNRVIMLSSETCSSGNNLTEATHIIFADVMNATAEKTKDIETQAIGRAVRLGQKKPVIIKRLIMEDTIESSYYQKNKYDMKDLQFQQTNC